MNERVIRITYGVIFGITCLISLITLGITASLVSKYNKDGYPPDHTGAYRDRIRLLLVASVWTTFFSREYQLVMGARRWEKKGIASHSARSGGGGGVECRCGEAGGTPPRDRLRLEWRVPSKALLHEQGSSFPLRKPSASWTAHTDPAVIFNVGFQLFGHSTLWGILPHLIWVAIGFILFLIGSSALTALTDKISCGDVSDAFERCNMVKASVVTGWISTILCFIALLYLIGLAFKARAWGGVHRQNLYVDA